MEEQPGGLGGAELGADGAADRLVEQRLQSTSPFFRMRTASRYPTTANAAR